MDVLIDADDDSPHRLLVHNGRSFPIASQRGKVRVRTMIHPQQQEQQVGLYTRPPTCLLRSSFIAGRAPVRGGSTSHRVRILTHKTFHYFIPIEITEARADGGQNPLCLRNIFL